VHSILVYSNLDDEEEQKIIAITETPLINADFVVYSVAYVKKN